MDELDAFETVERGVDDVDCVPKPAASGVAAATADSIR